MLAASDEILDECLACGGSVTGEHGIGVEKISFMNRMFTDDDLDVMTRLRDAFNPDGLLSPGKMLPTAGACGMEQVHPGRRAALVKDYHRGTDAQRMQNAMRIHDHIVHLQSCTYAICICHGNDDNRSACTNRSAPTSRRRGSGARCLRGAVGRSIRSAAALRSTTASRRRSRAIGSI